MLFDVIFSLFAHRTVDYNPTTLLQPYFFHSFLFSSAVVVKSNYCFIDRDLTKLLLRDLK